MVSLGGQLAIGIEMDLLQVNNISKGFGELKAVTNVTFSVGSREVVGLLGPNGSGKSTMMKLTVGVLKPDSGTIQILGLDVASNPTNAKMNVGFVPESPRLYEFLTGVEYLDFVAELYGVDRNVKRDRISEFLKALDLESRENELIHGYSQGMKQKLAIIAAMLHRPKILVLDEPLNALDPKSARIVKELIHKFRDEAVPTIFSTHVLEIAQAICDRLIIMYQGRIIAEGTAEQLKTKAGSSGSTLEEVFLKLTGTSDTREIVEALWR